MSLFHSGKFRKSRIIGLAASNEVGVKLSIIVIGKSANFRCFKKELQIYHHASTRAMKNVRW